MQVTDKFNLLPPSICIICETQPDGKVIDTLYGLKTGVASVLNGRKYVCERCVGEFARLLGYEKGEDVKQAKIDAADSERRIANVKARVAEIGQVLIDFVAHPGADEVEEVAVSDTAAGERSKNGVKPSVEESFPAEPEEKGGTTVGVYKADDIDGSPAVASPGVASSAPDGKPEKAKGKKGS